MDYIKNDLFLIQIYFLDHIPPSYIATYLSVIIQPNPDDSASHSPSGISAAATTEDICRFNVIFLFEQ